jgi:hypothetical protein
MSVSDSMLTRIRNEQIRISESIEKGWHLFGVTPQYDVVGVNTVSSDWADRHEGEKLTAKNTP